MTETISSETILAPAASARPDVISLDILLTDVDRGLVRIPRFQRPYVWSAQMMRELFESVLNGYPIGSLLFWTPRQVTVSTMEKVGPLRSPEPASQGASLVLDGHQRLATLYGVLRLPEDFPRDEEASSEDLRWWIGYDLEKEEVRQMRRPQDFDSPTILPLRSLLRTVDFVKFARALDTKHFSSSQKELYLDRADRVQRAVRDYRIGLTIMRDGNVDDAVAIFSRINRSGRKMTADQMAVALTYHDGFNLEDGLDTLLVSLAQFGFGGISRNIPLQALLHGAHRNFTKPNFDDLRNKGTQEALLGALPVVEKSLTTAAQFLNSKIGCQTVELLPYALQLLCLSAFFLEAERKKQPITARIEGLLIKWFWATSFEGWFASANTSDVERAVEAMEMLASAPDDPDTLKEFEGYFLDRVLRPFPKTFDRRSSRIRTLLLVQINRGRLLDPVTGNAVDGSELMSDAIFRDLPYIFAPAGTKQTRSPANRMLLARSHGGVLRKLLAENSLNAEALLTHGINKPAIEALVANERAEFIRLRELELERQESEFLRGFGLSIGNVERSNEEVDIEFP